MHDFTVYSIKIRSRGTKGLATQKARATPAGMRSAVGVVLLLMAFTGISANSGSIAGAPSKAVAEKVIRTAILARKFQGGEVEEIMLTEPERTGLTFRYIGEFTIRHSGRKIRCEDWRFELLEKVTGWIANETTPGRCND